MPICRFDNDYCSRLAAERAHDISFRAAFLPPRCLPIFAILIAFDSAVFAYAFSRHDDLFAPSDAPFHAFSPAFFDAFFFFVLLPLLSLMALFHFLMPRCRRFCLILLRPFAVIFAFSVADAD